MSMPKAAMNKNDRVMLAENQVRRPGQGPVMQAISVAGPMQKLADLQLRFCICTPYPRHHPGTGYLVHNIDHRMPG